MLQSGKLWLCLDFIHVCLSLSLPLYSSSPSFNNYVDQWWSSGNSRTNSGPLNCPNQTTTGNSGPQTNIVGEVFRATQNCCLTQTYHLYFFHIHRLSFCISISTLLFIQVLFPSTCHMEISSESSLFVVNNYDNIPVVKKKKNFYTKLWTTTNPHSMKP